MYVRFPSPEIEAIEEEIELFRALSDSKIGKLTLARLLIAKATVSENDVKGVVHYEEILELYNDLMALDSSHYHYYKDEHSVALLRKRYEKFCMSAAEQLIAISDSLCLEVAVCPNVTMSFTQLKDWRQCNSSLA
ncbi:BnaC06g41160D [Brassica napus]|uniref:BnaC06g41160D protein n=1 Tax=Brassica napus TaxID=3708 RepID=A0A078J3V7_BRANA|nr:BnaC06g41160D [Brassica napus]